jgi:hypothetical protein
MQSVPPLPAWAMLTPIARSRSSAALSRPVPIPRPWCPGVTSTSGLLPARSTAAKPTARPSSTARYPSRTMATARGSSPGQQRPPSRQRSQPELLHQHVIGPVTERPQHPATRHARHHATPAISQVKRQGCPASSWRVRRSPGGPPPAVHGEVVPRGWEPGGAGRATAIPTARPHRDRPRGRRRASPLCLAVRPRVSAWDSAAGR